MANEIKRLPRGTFDLFHANANGFSTCKRVSIERTFWSAHGMRARNRCYVVVAVSEAWFGQALEGDVIISAATGGMAAP